MENAANVLGLAMVLGLVLASIVAWCIFIAGVSTGATLRYVPRRKVPWGLIDLVLAVLVIAVSSSIALQLLVEIDVIEPGKDAASMPPANSAIVMLASSVSILVGVVLSLGLIWLKNRPTSCDLGISSGNLRRDVRVGLAAFLLISAPVYAIQYLLVEILDLRSEHPLIELVKQNPKLSFFAVSFLAAVVIAPVTEEILFRVLLQGWLERIPGHRGETKILLLGGADVTPFVGDIQFPRRNPSESRPERNSDRDAVDEKAGNPYVAPKSISPKPIAGSESPPAIWPVVISSTVFALMHSSHGVDPIPLFVLAFGLGFVYRQTHSVIPCIIIHMLFNGFSLALLMAEVYG